MKILLLEDDYELAAEVSGFLKARQFSCDVVYDGLLVMKQLSLQSYDIVLLDINVPGINGFEVCAHIRKQDKKIPILMLTAYDAIDDKLKAFNTGADDYLVKPFHFEELLARLNSLLRRKEMPQSQEQVIGIHDLIIDLDNKQVKRGDFEISLTPKEFKLLTILAEAKGRTLSKQFIAQKLWDYHIETSQNTIEVYINFLRNKIDRNHEVKLIHTKVGFGYYLNERQ
ncbi:response regulator transcription factor [Pollutibacter soli]|uniref:response regulator transcription factor n=1 Tax=Pollutibacter soli TaxID=3034157 RepID=UPI003013F459